MICLLGNLCRAQKHLIKISGTVTDSTNQSPLDHASVYLSNTTIGTTTSEQGTFVLANIPPGKYDLIVSYLGYETRVISINEQSDNKVLKIELPPNVTQLKGVVVRPGVQDKRYLAVFERYFIGMDENASKCRILNPKVLFFDMDTQTNVLTAHADGILKIRNDALGYMIYFDLQSFQYDFVAHHVVYFGHPRFEDLSVKSKGRKKRWNQNRIRTYLGSRRHFMKSLINRRLKEEGFEVKKLVKAQDTVQADSGWLADSSGHRRIMVLPAGNFVYSHTLPYDSMIGNRSIADSSYVKLQFNNSLYVVPFYYKTPDKNSFFGWKRDAPLSLMTTTTWLSPLTMTTGPAFPTSILTMTAPEVFIDRNGVLTDPLAIAVEGGWAYNQVADLLPLDYKMPGQK